MADLTKKQKYALAILAGAVFVLLAWSLPAVFRGDIILPQVFHVGPLALRYYGLCMALAVAGGYLLALQRAKRYGFSAKDLDRLVLVLVVCGFAGARLYHVASDFHFYVHNPALIPAVWQGGLSIFGALIGGVVGLAVARRWWFHSISLLVLLDWLVPSLLLGQIIGRFGNFFNYEIFGYPTNLPWKMFVPFQFRPEAFLTVNYFHPLFLYEALFNAVILFLVLRFWPAPQRRAGTLFFMYLLLYNAGRFFLEMYRTDSTYIFGNALRLNSISTAVLMGVALVGLYYTNHHYAQNAPSNH
jgi:phosphatidylglycerol---prolipoprotein diacylglyceryl transferase